MNNSEIQKKIDALPSNIKNAIHEFDWAGQVMNIGRAHNLHLDDIEQFRIHTLLVIIGDLAASNYHASLVKEIGVDRDVAESLVQAANEHIFTELQRRAFGNDNFDEKETPHEPIYEDPYNEPIHPDDIRGVFQQEGIRLIDDEDSKTHFQEPIRAEEYQQEFTNLKHEETPEPNKRISSKDIQHELPTPEPLQYQEPIEENDLRGIPNYHVQESTQKKVSQPSSPFSDRFDQHLMDKPFIAKGDVVDVSPTPEDTPENFLKTLQ